MTYSKIILYARFSDDRQAAGTTLVRQFGDLRRKIEAEGWIDIPSCQLSDSGMSAFHGHNRQSGELGRFEAEAIGGQHHNTLLMVERLDRLSRQGHEETSALISNLIKNGVTVMTLDGDLYRAGEQVSLIQVITGAVKAEVGREHSRNKSDLAKANWRLRVEKGGKQKSALSSIICPPWLDVIDGAYVVNDMKADLITRIFEMADSGSLGSKRIAHILNEEGGKPAGWSHRTRRDAIQRWQRSEIVAILRNRALVGEYQPKSRRDGKLVKNGEPIQGFYPPAIDTLLFDRVGIQATARKSFRGGTSSPTVANLVSGLVRCGECNSVAILNSGYLYCAAAYENDHNRCSNKSGIKYRADGLERTLC